MSTTPPLNNSAAAAYEAQAAAMAAAITAAASASAAREQALQRLGTDRFLRTRAWSADEYIRIDGAPYVYTYDRDAADLRVHFPGRHSALAGKLREWGHVVTLPARARKVADL